MGGQYIGTNTTKHDRLLTRGELGRDIWGFSVLEWESKKKYITFVF